MTDVTIGIVVDTPKLFRVCNFYIVKCLGQKIE